MIKYAALVILVTVRLMYHPDYTQTTTPFATTPVSSITISRPPAQLISFSGTLANHHKVLLQWIVGENETANQFEVEKSLDGKNFVMAALVFGTDKSETDNYQFYEKVNTRKISYRIKLIGKDQKIEYSPVIEINSHITS